MRILWLHRQETAVGYYRCWTLAALAQRLGHEVTFWREAAYHKALQPKDKTGPRHRWPEKWMQENLGKYDLLVVDRAVKNEEWAWFAGFKHHSPGMRMVVDFDDLFTDVPWWNPAHMMYSAGQEAREAGLSHLRVAELATVSTANLAEQYKDLTHEVRVIENRVDPKDWQGFAADPARKDDPHLRVLYGGANGHFGDLEDVKEGLIASLRRQKPAWRLICFGALPSWAHEMAKEMPGKVVTLPWIPFEDYPETVAWGGFDLAIAPLSDHPFNLGKSNIKWVEAGIQKIPLVASDVGPYSEIPDGCALKVSNTPAQWAETLNHALEDRGLREKVRDRAYEAVRESWVIDRSSDDLQITLEEAMARPRIESLEDTRLPGDLPVTQPVAELQDGSAAPTDEEPASVENRSDSS